MSEHIPPVSGTEPEIEPEIESFPIEPYFHPVHTFSRKIYDFLASAKLAMALLITILVCCVVGVTIFRGVRAGEVIFATLWFNALLVLLIVNIAFCFFGRMWHRKLTLISFGMILFHLSFVSILAASIYNSLFYFRGSIRLTEGEVLPSGDPQSYDVIDKGRFFSYGRLKGKTSLIKMHAGYKVGSEDKRVAYEVAVGEGKNRKQGLIYITHKLTRDGVDYFNEREGYSLLVTLANKQRQELYGAHLPLQSIKQENESYVYTTGYKNGDAVKSSAMPFPPSPETPRFALQVAYRPSPLKERGGEAWFRLSPLDENGMPQESTTIAEGKAAIGEQFAAGEYILSAKEVRYWVVMQVIYEPGKPIVLASLWVGLAGMIITTFSRMTRRKSGKKLHDGKTAPSGNSYTAEVHTPYQTGEY